MLYIRDIILSNYVLKIFTTDILDWRRSVEKNNENFIKIFVAKK